MDEDVPSGGFREYRLLFVMLFVLLALSTAYQYLVSLPAANEGTVTVIGSTTSTTLEPILYSMVAPDDVKSALGKGWRVSGLFDGAVSYETVMREAGGCGLDGVVWVRLFRFGDEAAAEDKLLRYNEFRKTSPSEDTCHSRCFPRTTLDTGNYYYSGQANVSALAVGDQGYLCVCGANLDCSADARRSQAYAYSFRRGVWVSQFVYQPSLACQDQRGFRCLSSTFGTPYADLASRLDNETISGLVNLVRAQDALLRSGPSGTP